MQSERGKVRGMSADEDLDAAIVQYAIYLGDKQTEELDKKWTDIENCLRTFLGDFMCLIYRSPSDVLDDQFKPELTKVAIDLIQGLGLLAEQMSEIITSIHFRRHLQTDVGQFLIKDSLGKILHPVVPSIRTQLSIVFDLIKKADRETDRSAIVDAVLSEAENLVKQLQGTLVALKVIRHRILAPALKSIAQRHGTKKKPRDIGTRDLLRAALRLGLTLKDLAMRLVERGLDGGLDGKPKGSHAQRVRMEKMRLTTILRNATKVADLDFPSIQYP